MKADTVASMKNKTKAKDPWKIATGHRAHITGSGKHDTRPRGMRKRCDIKRAAIKDSW